MRVEKLLDDEDVWYRIVDKDTINEDVEDIVKTIIMKVGEEDFMAFCLLKDDLVSYDKLREEFGVSKARMADEAEVFEHSTSPPGGCCPLLVECPVYFDPKIKNLDVVHLGSGDVDKGLEMKAKDLINIVAPNFLDVSVPK